MLIYFLFAQSNPDVMSNFLYEMGLSKEWGVVDVIGFDPELLSFLPQPVVALILLYPVSKVKSTSGDAPTVTPDGVYFMKQTIRNACGTIALLHSVGNNLDQVPLTGDSILQKFFSKTKDMSPEERGRELENSTEISQTHETSAQAGQTAAPALDSEVDYHFVAFVHKSGKLLELDGRLDGAIEHGSTSESAFLTDAAAACTKIMSQNPDVLNFTAVALTKLSA
jgi:ubiquitin carboxyl-terminal hydrolase L3